MYCRKAGTSGPPGSYHVTGPGTGRSLSVRCQARLGQRGASALKKLVTAPADRDRSYVLLVRTARAPAFPAIAVKVARSFLSRNGFGGYTGTGITPAARQPRNAATKSSDGGYTRIARSPGAKPQPDNAPATRSAA